MRTVRNSSHLLGTSASVHAGIPPPRPGTPLGPGTSLGPGIPLPPWDQAPPPPGPGTPPPTDRGKNITFATSLRTVIKKFKFPLSATNLAENTVCLLRLDLCLHGGGFIGVTDTLYEFHQQSCMQIWRENISHVELYIIAAIIISNLLLREGKYLYCQIQL